MMARQVRPWQAKPILHRERKARESVKDPASRFHQGHKTYCLDQESEYMAAIFTCLLSSIDRLTKRGATIYVSKLILKSESGNHDEYLSVITAAYGTDKLAR